MRTLMSLLAALVVVVSIFLAHDELSVLDSTSREPSAIQVTQVHSEAQTILLSGILILLGILAVQGAFRGQASARLESVRPAPTDQGEGETEPADSAPAEALTKRLAQPPPSLLTGDLASSAVSNSAGRSKAQKGVKWLWITTGVAVIVGLFVCATSVAIYYGLPIGSSPTVISASQSVTVTTSEFKFTPSTIAAAPGQTINITLSNAGVVRHSFTLTEANFALGAEPGQFATGSFKAPSAGSYTFFCDQPGHKDAGMLGQLIVR